ncbi:MAG: TrkH family potassium uptake protein [Myxococcales bacterium]
MSSPTPALAPTLRGTTVLKYLGQLCLVQTPLVLLPLLLALAIGRRDEALRHAIVLGVLAVGGGLLSRLRAHERIHAYEAMVLAAASFVVAPLAMTWPMMSHGLSFVDALFESVSGVTTTGLSTRAQVQDMPATFHFGRALMQWYGGMGVVVFSVALVLRSGALTRVLSGTEHIEDDLVGGSKAHARRVLGVYGILTVACGLSLWALGAEPFHAIVYALSAVSTGGFSPHDDSLAGLGGPAIQTAVILFCLAGSTSLVWYRKLWHDGLRVALRDEQVRTLLSLSAISVVLLSLLARFATGMSWLDALHHGPLMALSAQTTAGFSSIDPSQMSAGSRFIMMGAMLAGGGAGSTAGGIKVLRFLILTKVVHAMLIRISLPAHAVYEPKLGDRRIEREEIQEALTVILLFIGVIVLSWFAFLVAGHRPFDALFEVVSATGTVGLSTGLSSAADLAGGLKLVLCLDMWMGRLEVLPFLMLIYPGTWRAARGE